MDKMNLKSKMKTMHAVIKSVCDYKNGDMYLTEIIGVYKSKKTAEKIKVLYQEKDGDVTYQITVRANSADPTYNQDPLLSLQLINYLRIFNVLI